MNVFHGVVAVGKTRRHSIYAGRKRIDHRVVGGENFREGTVIPDHMDHQLQCLAGHSLVGLAAHQILLAAVFDLVVPAPVRIVVAVEQVDGVRARHVAIGQQKIIEYREHPIVECLVVHVGPNHAL